MTTDELKHYAEQHHQEFGDVAVYCTTNEIQIHNAKIQVTDILGKGLLGLIIGVL